MMKKLTCILLICALCVGITPGLAAQASLLDNGKEYTLKTNGMTVLQGTKDETDRHIVYDTAELAANPVIQGESPTTGMTANGDTPYIPMLVQISHASDKGKTTDGKTVEAAGLGRRAPWGVHYADIVYESVLWAMGETRLVCLFNDSFAQGQPTSVGPVRSSRNAGLMMSKEWGGGFIYTGCSHLEREFAIALEGDLKGKAIELNSSSSKLMAFKNRVQGVKAPDNYNVNVLGMRAFVPENAVLPPRPFLFFDESPYADGYQQANRVCLDWGDRRSISNFVYDENTKLYHRFNGERGGAPYRSFAAAEERDEAGMTQISFSNVIIQRVEYTYPMGAILPFLEAVGEGNADIFIGGRYIPGYWVKQSIGSPTVFFDDQGRELRLSRGKTFIAHFSPMRLLAYGAE